MLVLGIETSCDETGLALVEAVGGLRAPKFKILKNLVASQIKIHRPFGGVVPNLAKREHLKNLPLLFKKLLPTTYNILPTINLIAVTVGPGLEPALWTGIIFAKELVKKYKKTIVGVNHLEGHLYSFLLTAQHSNILKNIRMSNLFPAIALIVSGGHTILLKMESLTKWKKLGETRDDAAGESFDKVARMLRLPYPGGPEIEKLARRGDPEAINFPRPMIHDKSYDFSFSGLKTSVFYYLRDYPRDANLRTHPNIADNSHVPIHQSLRIRADVAASFQQAIVDVLVQKTIRAAELFGAKSVMLSGGVAANKLLRATLKEESEKRGLRFFVPDFIYNTDNAVMIAVAGFMAHLRKKGRKLVAQGNLAV